MIHLPVRNTAWPHDFAFLSSVIHAFVHQLFPGMQVTGCYQFRVTRNSNLFVDEEDVDDLRRALEGQLPERRFGDEVRQRWPTTALRIWFISFVNNSIWKPATCINATGR